jgi:hypothetical protein
MAVEPQQSTVQRSAVNIVPVLKSQVEIGARSVTRVHCFLADQLASLQNELLGLFVNVVLQRVACVEMLPLILIVDRGSSRRVQ